VNNGMLELVTITSEFTGNLLSFKLRPVFSPSFKMHRRVVVGITASD
jgi:hypothetical protein